MSSITKYQTASGKDRWRVSVFAGTDPRTGKKKYATKKGIDTKQKAALIAARLEVAVAEGSLDKPQPKVMTFQAVYEEWYSNYETTVRASTRVLTSNFFKHHIIPSLGKYRIATITTRDVQKAVKSWATVSNSAYRRWFGFSHQIFLYALERGYIHEDPARFVKVPKPRADTISDADKFWDKADIEKFLSCIDPELELEKYAMFRLYCVSGMRRAELLALHFDDFDFENSTISIVRTLSIAEHGRQVIQPPKTKASKRVVPIDAGTMHWLKKWRVESIKNQLAHGTSALSGDIVFPSTRGGYKSLNTPRRWLLKIIQDNGLKPINLHKLRHSYISNLLVSGAPVSTVQKLVGHSDPAITLEVYSHVRMDDKKKAADGLAKYLDL